MIHYIRTDAGHKDFLALVAALDADLAIRDGEEHGFYAQYNKPDDIRHVIVAYEDDAPIGCGAVKQYAPGIMEVKRMYVPPAKRGLGVATGILGRLEQWCREMGYARAFLKPVKSNLKP